MTRFFNEIAGWCSVRQMAIRSRHLVVNSMRWWSWTAATLGCCVLLSPVLFRGNPFDRFQALIDFTVLASVCSLGMIRQRDGSLLKDPPADPATPCGSYSRFSSDMQREESISDQQRKCREKAEANGHVISPELEFSDEAVSGTKRHRIGLDAMLAAAEAGRLEVLYFHSLSRLSRESVITLPLLKQLVYNYGVRVVSVTEGIDSNDTAWELIAHIMSIVHEQYVKDLAENVLRGQEGAILAGFAVGDHCFGFSSAPIPGSEQVRRGRSAKPRKIYVIDSETSAWVARIFHWFVQQRRSLRWITRELNRLQAPKDHRATTKQWRHQYLPRLLRNRKYIGQWPWGETKNVRDPLTGKVRHEDRSPEECEKWCRHLPHLRLIDDETFQEAERLLKINEEAKSGNRKEKGRFNGSKPGSSACHPRHVLSQLIVCGDCGRTLSVGGSDGKYLFCPGYQIGVCSCQTQLRRDRAERMILDEIARRILANPAWRELVLEEAEKAWTSMEASIPSELAAAQRSLVEVQQKITNLLDRMENDRGGPELDERLALRRVEKRALTEQVERLEREDQGRPPLPTEAWMDEQLGNLAELLTESTPAAAHALRNLVGGSVVVTEIRQPGRKRHYLQGRFTITVKAVVQRLIGSTGTCSVNTEPASGDISEEIVIDFREPSKTEALSERAKQLYDEGLMNAQIAKRLECSPSRLTFLLRFWFKSRDMVMPDGRSRRSMLKQKHLIPPLYQQIADAVMDLFGQQRLLQDIADTLHVDRNTVTAAIRWWHDVHNLPVPDGRTRRKELEVKTSAKYEKADADSLEEPSDRTPEDCKVKQSLIPSIHEKRGT